MDDSYDRLGDLCDEAGDDPNAIQELGSGTGIGYQSPQYYTNTATT